MSDQHDWPLGAALEKARIRRGMTKSEAARTADVSPTSWMNFERGYEVKHGQRFDVNPKADTVAKLARAVGLDIDEALGMMGYRRDDLSNDVLVSMAEPVPIDLSTVPHRALLAELDRRLSDGRSFLDELSALAHDPEMSEDIVLPGSGPRRLQKDS